VQSSPFSNKPKNVKVTVSAGSPLAELFLVDHDFALVDRAVGSLEAKVPQGVYKVKATLGEAMTEELVVLNENRAIDLASELQVASPAPLEGTGLTHEFHVALAADASTKVEKSAGQGAQVLIVSRRYSSEERPATEADARSAQVAPLAEVSLQSPDGETILDLAGQSGWDPVAGKTVELSPGSYRLHWRHHAGPPLEQTVHAVEGWQTQVFLLEEAEGPEEALRNKVSILMSKEGFNPESPELLLAEQARTALADERKVADVANNALFAKFDNPMLGLFGAHLMLLGRDALKEALEARAAEPALAEQPQAPLDFDQDIFNGAVANLRSLLGEDQPDVIALSTKATDVERDSIRPIDAPPMLWRSWLLLIEASNRWPDLVPVGIWRDTARVLPLRPFFTWSAEVEKGDTAAELEMARLMKRTVDEAAGAAASAAADGAQRELTGTMLAPRAAIEELIRNVS
jgi:hypothetical protein